MPYLRKRNSGRFLPAKNTRLVEIARQNTKNLVRFNRQNVINAIAATGYPVTIYVPLRQGRPCTCGNISKNILDEYGDMDRATIESLVLDEDIEILPYTSDPSIPQDPAQQTDAQRKYTVLGEQDYEDRQVRQIDEGVQQELDAIDDKGEDIILRDNQTCAICFGTQIIGGYELVGGHRLVLESTTVSSKSSLVQMNATDRPNSFTLLEQDATISWQASLPKGGQFALVPVLYNNRVVVDETQYLVKVNGTTITTPADVLAACTGQLATIEIVSQTNQELIATHLEFVVYFSTNLMSADFPSIDKMMDINRADPISSVSLTVGGNFWLPKNTVVIDHLPKVSRHWKASNSTPRRSQFGDVYDTMLETRNLDPYELVGMLRPLRQEIPPKSY